MSKYNRFVNLTGGVPMMTFREKVKYWWRRGWDEYPEVMGASVVGMSSFALTWYFFFNQHPEEVNYRYRHKLEVLRPDDPRLLRVRKYDDSPAITHSKPGFVPTVGLAERDWKS